MSETHPLHIPRGFRFASGTAGLKQSGSPDLVIAVSETPASVAAVFTTNQFVAAPVLVGRRNLKETGGKLRAIVVNSGNANCATGEQGIAVSEKTCRALADSLRINPAEILPSSTGIIGVPLPVEKITAALPKVVSDLSSSEDAVRRFARAIMTTDTRAKVASGTVEINGKRCSILGCAKGAGMIHPNMATMLAYIFTDIAGTPAELNACFRSAVARSFNAISIDGDTSTNDTAVIMANGASAVSLASASSEFAEALTKVCEDLAYQIVSDGEGVKHVIRLTVTGAESDYAAHRIADTIATSMLVKTAWAGADPNWGRMVAAVGRSGEIIDVGAINVAIQGTPVCRSGARVEFDATHLHQRMQEFDLRIDLAVGNGPGTCTIVTSDLTEEYVHINADYST
jgi:glutamate N-acetyltransferase/amino-acid N-acetyltransferase